MADTLIATHVQSHAQLHGTLYPRKLLTPATSRVAQTHAVNVHGVTIVRAYITDANRDCLGAILAGFSAGGRPVRGYHDQAPVADRLLTDLLANARVA